jgi:hypothetical protein
MSVIEVNVLPEKLDFSCKSVKKMMYCKNDAIKMQNKNLYEKTKLTK